MNKLLLISGLLILVGCNKEAGPGGSAEIIGYVTGQNHESAKNEATDVIVPAGGLIEHGDYWVLNSPSGKEQFYIWYHNNSWMTEGDPNLAGRTGVRIDYQYSNTNLEIAQMTADSIESIAGDHFAVDRDGDIIHLISVYAGLCTDADKMSSNFEFDVVTQGKDVNIEPLQPMIDEKVYITYGDNTTYDDVVRTGGEGDFSFKGLTKGTYRIYLVSKDIASANTTSIIEQEVEITEKKQFVVLDGFEIFY